MDTQEPLSIWDFNQMLDEIRGIVGDGSTANTMLVSERTVSRVRREMDLHTTGIPVQIGKQRLRVKNVKGRNRLVAR